MRKALVFTLLIVLLLSVPCSASHVVAGEYDLLSGLWVWEAAGDHPLTDWLYVGYRMRCVSPAIRWKTVLPSWAPVRQDYEVWVEAERGAWSIRLTDWCNHWLAQSDVPWWEDTHGLTVRVQWRWR